MFNSNDICKWSNSEGSSNIDGVSGFIVADNLDKAKIFIENYEIIEPISIGVHSTSWKVR